MGFWCTDNVNREMHPLNSSAGMAVNLHSSPVIMQQTALLCIGFYVWLDVFTAETLGSDALPNRDE